MFKKLMLISVLGISLLALMAPRAALGGFRPDGWGQDWENPLCFNSNCFNDTANCSRRMQACMPSQTRLL